MSEYGKLLGPGKLEFRRNFDADIEKVWQFLVDPEKRKLWFCGGSTGDAVGGTIVFDFDHRRLSESPAPAKYAEEETVTHYGEILEYDPPNCLAFDWFENGHEERSTVRIVLNACEDGSTDLHLVHDGLAGRDVIISVLAGWHGHFELLREVLSGPRQTDYWVLSMRLEAEYEERV